MKMNDIHFYVVTEQNFEEFKKRFIKENGDLVGYVLSVRDYETLALNMAELKRYLLQPVSYTHLTLPTTPYV